jgi:hypothetical protein
LKGEQDAQDKKENSFDRASCNARTTSGSVLGLRLDRHGFAASGGKLRLVLQKPEAGLELHVPSRAYQQVQTSPDNE